MSSLEAVMFRRLNAQNRSIMPLRIRKTLAEYKKLKNPESLHAAASLDRVIKMRHDRARNRAVPHVKSGRVRTFPKLVM